MNFKVSLVMKSWDYIIFHCSGNGTVYLCRQYQTYFILEFSSKTKCFPLLTACVFPLDLC